MAKEKISYRKLFSNIAESKGYKVKKPTYLQRKKNIDIIIEGQSDGKAQEVTIDIKKETAKMQTNGFTLNTKILKVVMVGYTEILNLLFLKLPQPLYLFQEKP